MKAILIRIYPAVLPMFIVLAGCSSPLEQEEHEEDVVAVEVTDLAGGLIASYQAGVWTFATGDALVMAPGEEVETRIFFVTADGEREQFPPAGDDLTLGVEIGDPAVVEWTAETDHGHFEALAVGTTTAVIKLLHGGHSDFETNPGLPIDVLEDS